MTTMRVARSSSIPLWRAVLLSTPLMIMPLMGMAHAQSRPPEQSGAYRLGPLDKLRVRVHEWRATRDEVYEWSAIKEDHYTVSASGSLTLPLAGEMAASGLTTLELATAVAQRLKSKLGMADEPDTSVEVVEYRPFYIIGQVDKPGEYPFRPGLTVLKALSIAGGMQRVSDLGLFRLERDAINAEGDLNVIAMERMALLARQSRLQSEANGLREIAFSQGVLERSSEPSIAMLIEQERIIFEARNRGLETQISALEQLKSYLAGEVASLEQQAGKEERQIELVKQELKSVSSLVDKGLSSAPRQLMLQRTLAQIESEQLRVNTSVTKARQDMSRTDISILELRTKRVNEIANDLRQTQARLEELAQRAATSSKLMHEASVTAPQFLVERMRARRAQPVLKIVRVVDGQSIQTIVSETATVEPGDTIKVELPGPDSAGVTREVDSAAVAAPESSDRLPR